MNQKWVMYLVGGRVFLKTYNISELNGLDEVAGNMAGMLVGEVSSRLLYDETKHICMYWG